MTRTWMIAIALAACTRPAEDRATAELDVGHATLTDTSVRIAGGLAAIRELTDFRLELWSQAPVLSIELAVAASAAGEWTIVVRNALSDATLEVAGTQLTREPDQHPTVAMFRVPLSEGEHVLRVAPPDAGVLEPFRVAAMADIQTALDRVDEVFEVINAQPGLRFVVGMGDITERAELWEYELFDRQLGVLQIPFYTTLGNHELWGPFSRWTDRYGRASFQFDFKGVSFMFADSGNAGLDPLVETWIDDWIAAASTRTNIFLTHFPPLDPINARYGGFRSADDGRRLLATLAEGGVDLTLYGHVHTFSSFQNADIPGFISGGGGALPLRWDGIDRHFLVIEVDDTRVHDVSVVRID